MRSPSARTRKIVGLSAAPIAVLLAGAMVWQGSMAAFTATTRNAGNAWAAGQVKLTDDDEGRAGFNVQELVPGQTGEKCLVVTSTANISGEVRAYVENLSDSSNLADHITLKVERGTGGNFNDCTGFTPDPGALPPQSLTTLSEVNYDFATGGANWEISGTPPESKTYRATWEFDTTGLNQAQIDALQGSSVTMDMVWELQSDGPAN